jgi:DNA-binding XRE family transcriptional regulator
VALQPSERFAKALAAVLKEARENAGLSQKKLAALSGVGRTGIVTIEAGQRLPSIWLCKMLADGLNVPLGALMDKVEKRLKH